MTLLLQRRLKYVDSLLKHVSSILTIPAPLPLVTFRGKPEILNYKKSVVKNRWDTVQSKYFKATIKNKLLRMMYRENVFLQI